ncbi:hypothetical protein EGH22_10640 [Halomicroarcula sp. F28]|uniref:hypothetical protein n=1 Tax=Haloarcula salinisoli TaxID=2487746 RepID=UPI001C7339D1|nr:hypothetical protein [Halomicroarcula salinisoli]MBX0286786.1 hypothetical protein [Halomicroarcula salinisoli]
MTYSRSFSNRLNDYKQLNTIPASVSMAFLLVSAVQFGALPPLEIVWFNFVVPAAWTLPVSTAVIFLALFSSETNDISDYSQPEQFAIGGMLTMVYGWHFLPPDLFMNHLPLLGQVVHDTLMAVGSPLAGMIAMGVSVVGWAVLVN